MLSSFFVDGGGFAVAGSSPAAIVSSCAGRHPFAACLQALQHDAVDIGEIGFDPVYGYGMIVPLDGRP